MNIPVISLCQTRIITRPISIGIYLSKAVAHTIDSNHIVHNYRYFAHNKQEYVIYRLSQLYNNNCLLIVDRNRCQKLHYYIIKLFTCRDAYAKINDKRRAYALTSHDCLCICIDAARARHVSPYLKKWKAVLGDLCAETMMAMINSSFCSRLYRVREQWICQMKTIVMCVKQNSWFGHTDSIYGSTDCTLIFMNSSVFSACVFSFIFILIVFFSNFHFIILTAILMWLLPTHTLTTHTEFLPNGHFKFDERKKKTNAEKILMM